MHVIAEFTIVPIGVGVSLSSYVAEAEKVLKASGLHFVTHANGTNVEGEWDAVMAAIRGCHQRLHEMGAPRLHTDLRLGTRTDRDQRMDDKLASLRAKGGPTG
jgi:uncharacterized protein (TIGR00106 family)